MTKDILIESDLNIAKVAKKIKDFYWKNFSLTPDELGFTVVLSKQEAMEHAEKLGEKLHELFDWGTAIVLVPHMEGSIFREKCILINVYSQKTSYDNWIITRKDNEEWSFEETK